MGDEAVYLHQFVQVAMTEGIVYFTKSPWRHVGLIIMGLFAHNFSALSNSFFVVETGLSSHSKNCKQKLLRFLCKKKKKMMRITAKLWKQTLKLTLLPRLLVCQEVYGWRIRRRR